MKNSHGIYGKLVADLAPTLPVESKHGKKGVFKAPLKKTEAKKASTKKMSKSLQVECPPDDKEENDDESDENPMQHKGLPVQEHRGSHMMQLRFTLISYRCLLIWFSIRISSEFCIIKGWQPDELCDVLLLYKTIQLDPHFQNNYKELSRRMSDAVWHCDNNQCRQQVFFFSINISFYFLTMCMF